MTAADGPSGAEPSAWALERATAMIVASGVIPTAMVEYIALALDAARRDGMEEAAVLVKRVLGGSAGVTASLAIRAAAIRKARENA